MNFRHLLEKHKLFRQLFKEVNKWFSSTGIYLKESTIVDATIIEAASSTKNKAKARAPEMHQIQKGKQWFFGLKAHIGVDARTGLKRSLSTTSNFHLTLRHHEYLLAQTILVFSKQDIFLKVVITLKHTRRDRR